ncbi:hypothetical protein LTR91_021074 [Friedmanniomyces endolithicus]|uniref:PHD-type domain-containing protein n=1 Tax=Friedmanniomyces endolithicus TaxID=329885 RepID=A0AAN6H6J0_9PEZI|nr:hypothetical protein LTR57_020925 [Friedmanniomyces endolithicus]KAK0958983.1 hypothetical protein LTR91_021074 [Friedmanniomyces endolithicus]KAK0960812.1 hypothetical protein LTS01_020706 [Friedmanniomyces endolithicus]KAK1023382.1 hypothetical protein LTS16_024936 [Friedmanniomyces endolithicus]
MPPTSNMRKASLVPNSTVEASSAPGPAKRTASGRAIRSNRRPANYYARPFGSLSGPSTAAVNDAEDNAEPPGFFPALQYFSDAVAALPREVMRQFTLMKEVEAKIHGPSEEMGEMLDKLMELPIVSRKDGSRAQGGGGVDGGVLAVQQAHGLLSFTASNSATGSLINGVGGGLHSARGSIAASAVGEEDVTEEMARRNQYRGLRSLTNSLLSNMDEKNVVLAEANRVLALQLLRVDSVLPHVESELSEEARFGSMTHWAYSDNRVKKAGLVAASRRDVAATNNLAAAAHAIHETEIAQARRDAGREAHRDKAKGKRAPPAEHVESDFEMDRPKKLPGKSAKGKLQAPAQGLGISAMGEPVKRRRIDKALAAPAMERSNSGATNKGGKASKETARSTPAAEPSKKAATKTKPAALPTKKRVLNSTHNSPAMASSPLHSSFVAANMEPPPANAKPQSTRLRQNSMTNTRQERLVAEQEGISRPASAAGAKHLGKTNIKQKAQARPEETAEEQSATRTVEEAPKRKATNDSLKREDTDVPDAAATERPQVSRSSSGKNSISHSNSNSNTNSNHHAAARARGQSQSKTSTPRNEQGAFGPEAPSMLRTRSTRSQRNTGGGGSGGGGGAAGTSPNAGAREESSASEEPREQGVNGSAGVGASAKSGVKIRREQHQRSVSNSHLIKQLMPFNRSPDLDRGREGSEEDDEGDGTGRGGEEGDEGGDGAQVAAGEKVRDGRSTRPASRRNTLMRGETGGAVARTSPAPPGVADEEMNNETEVGLRQQQGGEEEDGQDDDEMPDVDGHHDDRPTALSPPPEPTTTNDPLPSPSPSPSPSASPPPALDPDLTDDPNPVDSILDEPGEAELDEPEDSDQDPDDPNEPKYCYCDRGSFGEMVACDNERCAKEWFHIECTELSEAPGDAEQWFCRDCRPVGKGGRRR